MSSFPIDLVIVGRNGRNSHRLRGLEPDAMQEPRSLLPVRPILPLLLLLLRIRSEKGMIERRIPVTMAARYSGMRAVFVTPVRGKKNCCLGQISHVLLQMSGIVALI